MMIVGIAIASIIISVLYLQISALQDQNKIINETNQMLETNLTNYQDLFGVIPKNYTSLPFALQTQVYVAQALDTEPVTKVMVNQPYQVIANITKMENVQPLIYYYCLVQVNNSTDLDNHIGWGQGIFTPKQTFSQCAVSWTPTTPGNYTITAFAWRSLMGSPLANAATNHVLVLPSSDDNPSSLRYENGTYTNFPLDYTITGDNKVLNSTLDSKSDVIILSTYTTEDDNLTVTLTPNLLNLIEKGTPFIVLTDGQEVKYNEHLDNQNMIMTIPFHSGTKEIEIIGTQVV
jgi:hypothetical protein